MERKRNGEKLGTQIKHLALSKQHLLLEKNLRPKVLRKSVILGDFDKLNNNYYYHHNLCFSNC